MVLYTIGHSTHQINVFLDLLLQHQIGTLVDVRSYPGSRRWPQFNQDEIKASVESAEIWYRWGKGLGGRRRSYERDSPHSGWQHRAFRSYADYADTPEFTTAIEI